MARSTMKNYDSGHPRQSSAGLRRSSGQGADLEPFSVALLVAAVEFPVCAAVLVALAALGMVSTAIAVTWAALILVPLSITIGFLGFRVGFQGRRSVRTGGATAPRVLSQVA